ncbi:SOS response-associated peptidase family protein [Arthrobacter halodurans]|uniref:SOS response-associated peptidase family protein n=1 Tax=Arthrobacter halodurans TaxID=516699 RepID=A0ABV4UNI8_9MICC
MGGWSRCGRRAGAWWRSRGCTSSGATPRRPGGGEAEWLMTTTILTRPAADALGHIHDRTPIIAPTDLREEWLDAGLTDKGGGR